MKLLSFYRKLLGLYPIDYRKQYGQQMVQTLSDMLDAQTTNSAKAKIWLRTALELPASLTAQNGAALAASFNRDRPTYIKRTSLVSALFLLPFAIALLANSLNQVIYGRTLQDSWLWSTPVLSLWVLILPLAAVLIGLAGFGLYAVKSAKPFKSLTPAWPILLVVFTGLFILLGVLFHDSAHCVSENPLNSISHPKQTWHCAATGFLGGK